MTGWHGGSQTCVPLAPQKRMIVLNLPETPDNSTVCQELQPQDSPLMTGVKTAMPAKLGSDTVLSKISPPTLQGETGEVSAGVRTQSQAVFGDRARPTC